MACENRYAGALHFTTGLLCICPAGLLAFHGKIGFMVTRHEKEDYAELFLCLPAIISGFLDRPAVAAATPARRERALEIAPRRLEIPLVSVFLLALLCGVLVYLAVVIYREKQNVLGILFSIPAFILAGFEHSIADMFYFASAGIASLRVISFSSRWSSSKRRRGMLIPALRLLMSGFGSML